MNRFFRVAVALLLVVVLVVSWSPIRARASALPEVAGVVTKVIPFNPGSAAAAGGAALGTQIFCHVCWGLGLLITTAQVIGVMNAYTEFSGELETSIYYYPDGTWSYGVDMGFVERVRAFLWNEGYLCADFSASISINVELYREMLPVALSHPYAALSWSGAGWQLFYSDFPIAFYSASSLYCPSGSYLYFTSHRSNGVWDVGSKVAFSYENFEFLDTISSPLDLTLGDVALPAFSFPQGYPEWHTNARPATNPDTQEEITVLPIPLDPNIQELPDTLTQPDVWQGSIADPMPDTGTDTDPEGGTSGDAPSTDIADYSLDLTQFFPFCLPFDIYAFFELLASDPEAPHLEFDIPFPYMEEPWHLVIDLSAWDETAELLRKLQLLAFIIGLCVFTREKFLRS